MAIEEHNDCNKDKYKLAIQSFLKIRTPKSLVISCRQKNKKENMEVDFRKEEWFF